ncbi:MAG: hypothetical protein KC421_28915 [Anaerolineales bacterium]|nr:hypothetical protein [Anaerolineales bacterium]
MLQVPIDPNYKKSVLQTAAAQAAVKRRKRSKLRARRTDVWSQYEDDETALERAGECASCDMFRPLDDQGLCLVCAEMLERDTSAALSAGSDPAARLGIFGYRVFVV